VPCSNEDHKLHMCALKEANMVELVRCLADQPTVECANCGALANRAENVCNPVQLSE
jgi:predicted nucleic acid-binding Zn ribbon protein